MGQESSPVKDQRSNHCATQPTKNTLLLSSPNQQCGSTDVNRKHWPQPLAWPHRFFIRQRTPEAVGVDTLTLALLYINVYYCNVEMSSSVLTTAVDGRYARLYSRVFASRWRSTAIERVQTRGTVSPYTTYEVLRRRRCALRL